MELHVKIPNVRMLTQEVGIWNLHGIKVWTGISHYNNTIFFCVFIAEVIGMSDEKRLIKHLLTNYETVGIVGRPVYNTSETVRVSYGLALIQILDLDEKNQVLTTNVWSRYVSLG